MTRDELIAIIQEELKNNPKATSIKIGKKHKMPFHIVEVFRIKIIREQKG